MDFDVINKYEKMVAACGGNPEKVQSYLESQIEGSNKYEKFINTSHELLKHSRWILTESDGYPLLREQIDSEDWFNRYVTYSLTDLLDNLLDRWMYDGLLNSEGTFKDTKEALEAKALADEIVDGGYGSFVLDW